ncbi:aa3-type cytochrome c oxidase subunit IV [Tropicimonas sp. TH_r6]|nr:aa3-type cytochrome c oxidase subunit IV [Tropicimonas sp. TH_r6]MDV7144668.1 aa3-type cytochrome c oxidase subunit IV [Tropicimonas sp. TH_r6]
MSDETHKPGSMDISVQEKTFDGFINFATKGAIFCILLLLFIGLVNG